MLISILRFSRFTSHWCICVVFMLRTNIVFHFGQKCNFRTAHFHSAIQHAMWECASNQRFFGTRDVFSFFFCFAKNMEIIMDRAKIDNDGCEVLYFDEFSRKTFSKNTVRCTRKVYNCLLYGYTDYKNHRSKHMRTIHFSSRSHAHILMLLRVYIKIYFQSVVFLVFHSLHQIEFIDC